MEWSGGENGRPSLFRLFPSLWQTAATTVTKCMPLPLMVVYQFITFKLERESCIVRPTEENEKETRAKSYIAREERTNCAGCVDWLWMVGSWSRDIAAPLELPGFYLSPTSRSFFFVCLSFVVRST